MTTPRPKLLDLFCGAGGASMGYHMAGFDVTGVDHILHPDYPFEQIVGDALTTPLDGYDAYSASPPCQGYTGAQTGYRWPRLIAPMRERLEVTGKPYVIENVVGAREHMRNPLMLCGSSFGLRIQRHRLFETNAAWARRPACRHEWQKLHQPYKIYVAKSKDPRGYKMSGIQPVHGGNHNVGGNSMFFKSVAMGIDWMTSETDINEAIPPLFTDHVGSILLYELSYPSLKENG